MASLEAFWPPAAASPWQYAPGVPAIVLSQPALKCKQNSITILRINRHTCALGRDRRGTRSVSDAGERSGRHSVSEVGDRSGEHSPSTLGETAVYRGWIAGWQAILFLAVELSGSGYDGKSEDSDDVERKTEQRDVPCVYEAFICGSWRSEYMVVKKLQLLGSGWAV